MEHYFMKPVTLLFLATFITALVFFFRAAKHFFDMLSEFRSGRHDFVANLVPFAIPFLSQLFTEKGNAHRIGFLANIFGFICCVGFIAVIHSFFGIGK